MIRVGIGGWTYEPWRGTFYPEGLKHADELRYAAGKLTSIEINGTFYRTQSAASFAKWRDETPEGFVFAVKGHRAVVNKKVLGEAGEALDWFLKSGITELGPKLGPLLWQFAPYKKFDPDDFGAFLALLPREAAGLTLRHVVEVRSTTFLVPEFVALARKHNVAVVYAHSDDYPAIADVTADFVYARLQKSQECDRHRLCRGRSRRLGKAGETVGLRWRGRRPAALRRQAGGEEETRRLRLHDRRRQGSRARRGPGPHRAAVGAASS